MNFEDESYVRLYTRDTVSWIRLGWEGQAVFCLLIRKVDRAGILDGIDDPVADLQFFLGMPAEVVRVGVDRLLEQEIAVHANGKWVFPRFVEAQAVVRGPKERQRECRERKADMARLGLDPQQRGAVIYFVQSENGGAIKIGRTTDLAKRLVNLSTGRPDELRPLATFSGTVSDELRLHALLATHRAKGEWFHDSPEVLSVVAYAAEHGSAVVEWLASRDVSQAVTPVVTPNSGVTLAEPSSSDPSSSNLKAAHRAPARRANLVPTPEPEPPSSPTVTEIRPLSPSKREQAREAEAASLLATASPLPRVYTMPSEEPPEEYLQEATLRGIHADQARSTWRHYWTEGLPKLGVERLYAWLLDQAKGFSNRNARLAPARAGPRRHGSAQQDHGVDPFSFHRGTKP